MSRAGLAVVVAGLLLAGAHAGAGAAAAISVAPGAAAAGLPPGLDACAARVAAAPDDDAGYRCFRDVANRDGSHAAVFARLEAILAADPRNALALWTLAGLDTALGSRRAQDLYDRAIAAFQERGEALREARARLEWAAVLQRAGRTTEAAPHVERARAIAAESGDEPLAADLAVAEAWQAFRSGDYSDAETRLAGAKVFIDSRGSTEQRAAWLSAEGAVDWARARYDESLAAYKEEARLWGGIGNRYDQAAALANVVLLSSRRIGRGDPSDEDRMVLGALLDEAAAAARAGGNIRIQGSTTLYRAQLTTDIPAQRALYEQAAELSARGGDTSNSLVAMRFLAELLVLTDPRDPERSRRLLAEAGAIAYDHGDLESVTRCRITDANLAWRFGDEQGWTADRRRQAFELMDRAIEAIEALRDLQADDGVRAEVFVRWLFFYNRMLGHLLGAGGGTPSRDDIAKGFEVAERRRARVLLERLDAAGIPLADPSHAADLAARHELLDEAARLRVDLSSPFLGDADRAAHVARLEAVAGEEKALRARLSAEDPRFERLRSPVIPSLEEVEAAARPDEAVLAFTIGSSVTKGGYIGGGSWLFVHTRGGTRVYRIPDEEAVGPETALFAGLFESRDGAEASGSARLYDSLLRAALDDLPPGVAALVVVPDGPLHQVPFAALRPSADAAPLGARYVVVTAPSVATWREWRIEAPDVLPAAALVIADPGAGDAETAAVRDPNGALPYARREARLAAAGLGGRAKIFEGAKASEARVKGAALHKYGVLHFAAHARLGDRRKAEAFLLLHPGAAGEDGHLTVAEASTLGLEGRIVVLAACRTAGGAFLEGEGVQSLARGFLAGGARAVIGSLWPLRDDEAADFFGAFYRRLGGGETVADAFASAQRDRLAAGAPAAAWAGLVLVGDGAVRLAPPQPAVYPGTIAAILALLVLTGAAALLRRWLRAGR